MDPLPPLVGDPDILETQKGMQVYTYIHSQRSGVELLSILISINSYSHDFLTGKLVSGFAAGNLNITTAQSSAIDCQNFYQYHL